MATSNTRRKGMKRPKRPHSDDGIQHPRMKRVAQSKRLRSPSPSSSSGHSSVDPSGSVTSEEPMVVSKEPSMYDGLLTALQSGSKSFAELYKRRQREQEGRSDLEEDRDNDSASLSASDKEAAADEGSQDDSAVQQMENELGEHSPDDVVEEADMEDDETSDEGQSNDLQSNSEEDVQSSKSTSSFRNHLGHTLSEAEVEDLTKRKWKFKWEVGASSISSMSKWFGTGQCFLKDIDKDSTNGLKKRLYKHWQEVYSSSGGTDFHSSKQVAFFLISNSYRDILHCNKRPFYLKGSEEDSSIMDAYNMHALNHVYRTRDIVTKNDAKVGKHGDNIKEEIINDNRFLDHGFTRPKVLILLPIRSIALRVIKRLIQLTPTSHRVNVEHLDRFTKEFGVVKDDDDTELTSNFLNDENTKSQIPSKPSDFEALFGDNDDDHFMIGIKFTKKSIKLYSDFYSSDVIVASPLGLITKIGEAEVEKEKDVDYLSSIEVLIIDHADVITMQNWSHVNSVVEQLNCLPAKQHGTDFMRIRQWYLNGHARFYRQTIVLSSFVNPDINALFNHFCVNYEGKVKLVSEYKGILPKVLLQVRQVYERFDAKSISEADDARHEYFSKKIFPKIKDSIQGGVMLFISSYFEFVRLRNFLKAQNASFCLLGEYTKPQDISRARVRFFQGSRKFLLYTERAHFYRRYKIRGIKNLIIYSLPERKEFYPEVLNMLEGSENLGCTILFSRFDKLRLERIVGTTASKRMLSSKKDIFIFF